MRRILVTGGAGFIGSNFIKYALNTHGNDISVVNLDLLTYAGNLENLKDVEDFDNYQFVKGDICDVSLVSQLLKKYDIDWVIHFAAESHVDRSILDPGLFIKTNVLGTNALLSACRNCWESEDGSYPTTKRFVHVSTDEVYGSLDFDGSFFTEETPLDPHSPYSASKASSDLIVKAYVDTYRFPAVITRCSNNYGPYQFPEKLIPLVINNALTGKNIPVYGTGTNVRDWLYVEDHANGIYLAAERGILGEVYNIGGHNEKTNLEIVKTIIDTLNSVILDGDSRKEAITYDLIKYVEDRKGHDLRYAIDPSKSIRELGWSVNHKFADGIRVTVEWYLENQTWLSNVTAGTYQEYYSAMYNKGEKL